MKTIKDKSQQQKEHHVETPKPPQVMNPSEPPENQNTENSETKKKGPDKKEKNKKSGGLGEPLTPNEEL